MGSPGVSQSYLYSYPHKTVLLLRVGVLTGQGMGSQGLTGYSRV